LGLNWLELCVFTENLGKLLESGIMFQKAVEVASGSMICRKNRKFAAELDEAVSKGLDLQQHLSSYNLPLLYLAILKCGHLTGRLPEALKAAAYFIRQFMPLRLRLRRCIQFSVGAYLISLLIAWIFLKRPPLLLLVLLVVMFLLPVYINQLKYLRHLLLAKLPFVGTWSRQLALMEFFLCMEISYNSTLTVNEMFKYSISAVGNSYLRSQMAPSLNAIDHGNSFADSLAVIPFISHGMITAVKTGELSGTLENTFHGFSAELKKIIEAKFELIKALTTACVINYGLLFPLVAILPLFISKNSTLIPTIGAIMGFVPLACARYALTQYLTKSAGVNLWWEQMQ